MKLQTNKLILITLAILTALLVSCCSTDPIIPEPVEKIVGGAAGLYLSQSVELPNQISSTPLIFDSENFDETEVYNPTTGEITAPQNCKLNLELTLLSDMPYPPHTFILRILVNGTVETEFNDMWQATLITTDGMTGSNGIIFVASETLLLSAGDVVTAEYGLNTAFDPYMVFNLMGNDKGTASRCVLSWVTEKDE